MDTDLRQLAVLLLLSTTILVRLVAHHQAGGISRDQTDGIAAEGGTVVAVAVRAVFGLGGIIGVLLWVVSPGLLPGTVDLPAAASWVGVALAEAGLVLLVAVHLALGVHFSGTLHLRDDHDLVRTGPYAAVRHPMYSSFLLLFTGLSLVMANVVLAALLLGSQVWVLAWRLRREEQQLAETFGSGWEAYRASTGTIVPSLRRRPAPAAR